MRPAKDNRKDFIVKQEIYENYIKPKYEVLFCLEDRTHIAQMWRSLGLVCLQCSNDDVSLDKFFDGIHGPESAPTA